MPIYSLKIKKEKQRTADKKLKTSVRPGQVGELCGEEADGGQVQSSASGGK